MNTGASPMWCFRGGRTVPDVPDASWQINLPDRHAEALSRLIPVLGCGEEAAAMAFDGLARAGEADRVATLALRQIAAEERMHDGLMHRLASCLPPAGDERAIRAARRLHVSLSAGGFAAHLARIAALDAAVCTILSRLLRPALPLANCPQVRLVLGRIRRDEARHVALSRSLALAQGSGAGMRDLGAQARGALASVLAIEADAFETLAVDPARLDRDVRRLPDRLLTA